MSQSKREYWDLDLPNQSKKRMMIVEEGLRQFGGIIHDRYSYKYFSGKQSWRNPLLLRVSLPEGDRWQFIQFTRIWLHRLPQVSMGIGPVRKPIPLRGNHDVLQLKMRRSYRVIASSPWIKDYLPDGSYVLLPGIEVVRDVLDGNLDLVLR